MPIHLLPTMDIDKASIVGNIDVLETIYAKLGLDKKLFNSDRETLQSDPKHIRFVRGDQLMLVCQCSIMSVCLGHESGLYA